MICKTCKQDCFFHDMGMCGRCYLKWKQTMRADGREGRKYQ